MGLAVASSSTVLLILKLSASWIVLQWAIELLVPRTRWASSIATFMKKANVLVVDVVVTFVALLVLLPSFVFIVLEVFGYVRERTANTRAKTLPEYVARGMRVLQGLEGMGERLRGVAVGLTAGAGDVEEMMYEQSEVVGVVSEPAAVTPQVCGNVLLAVCKHSESLERLFGALQPAEVDELIFCECEDFEFRGEKIVSLIGILRECMERQTEVVQAVDALCPILPPATATDCDEDVDDSGFIDC